MLNTYVKNSLAQGFSLLEVLLALFILSIGLLGIANLEITSILHLDDDYFVSIASQQVENIFERDYVHVGENEFSSWNETNSKLLPKGHGTFDAATKEISVCWFSRIKHSNYCRTNI